MTTLPDRESERLAQIPSGDWQLVVGSICFALGILVSFAATPFNGAGTFAAICFSFSGPLFFWGILLRYLSIIERKIDRLARRAPTLPDADLLRAYLRTTGEPGDEDADALVAEIAARGLDV